MATVGKWGITRDKAGGLSLLSEWPWYWRYPLAALGLGAIIFAVITFGDGLSEKQAWAMMIVAAFATLFLLFVTYELGCLLVVIVALWGATKLVGAVVPESWQKASRAELAEVRSLAEDAYQTAADVKAAVDDGAASGTTMGAEIEEAKAQAAAANAEALSAAADAALARADVAELQGKLDAICNRAPALCY